MKGDLGRARLRDRVSGAARAVVDGAGSGTATVGSFLLVLAWLAAGLVRGSTEAWLALLFAACGSVTFVMVFFIQHVTARDLRGVLLKLDELVAATEGAHVGVLRAERLPLNEQEQVGERIRHQGAQRAASDGSAREG